MTNKQKTKSFFQENCGQKGFAAVLATLLVLSVSVIITGAVTLATLTQQKIVKNHIHSAQAYYASESGIEDSLYRIIKGKNYRAVNSMNVGSAGASISISGTDNKIIRVDGEESNRFRNVQVNLTVDTNSISFYYGVQVGEGGLIMNNGSQIAGSVYSNGPIQGANTPQITGDAWVAGAANSINSINVGGNAHANTIGDSSITGDAYYQTIDDSPVGGIKYPNSPDPAIENMPISENNINDWKNDAAQGGVIHDDYTISDGNASLGPKKIAGNLTIANGADLTITGTIHITGNFNISNNAILRLGANYGEDSGVIIADGEINVGNNAVFHTNAANSYLMLLSAKSGPAINISNNSNTVIFYASAGNVAISNNAVLKEVTAYQISLSNNAQIIYESGLASAKFSSGVGAGWAVSDWLEVP